jgi:hypothetical protein
VPATPAAASEPPGATVVTSASLGADISAPSAIAVDATVTSGGSDGVRQIASGADIFISGTLRAADLGQARQALALKAPNGTVYVTGTIDTSGAAGTGQAGGALTIVARQLVVTGSILTAGGDGATAGLAGAVTLTLADGAFLSGTLDASGGNASAPGSASGGRGGDLAIQAGGDVVLGGTTRVRGGAAASTAGANANAGDAGTITIDSDAALAATGTLDGRGGFATVSGGAGSPRAGAAGTLKIGENAPPKMVGILVPLLLGGGDGPAAGGNGGAAQLEPHGGDLLISGVVDVSGGSSATTPGAGGTVDGHPGPENSAAGIDVSGQLTVNGGSITSGGAGNGAAGGVIKLVSLASEGKLTIESGGQVQVDGGGSGATGTAGGGGLMYLFTIHGDASIHGKLLARGGAAADPGGTGGGGGLVYVFTANAHDRMSGVLIVESDGVIDASGGTGTTGGSARNDGRPHSVSLFPARQDDEYSVENIAVLINSDGVHGPDRGWIDNRGLVIARGGAANGTGGDVVFHGKQQDGNETPLPGNVDMAGDGSGAPGDFAGE